MDHKTVLLKAPDHLTGERLDKLLAILMPDYTRTTLQSWIERGLVTVNSRRTPQKYRPRPGDQIAVAIPPPAPSEDIAEPIELDIVEETGDFIVINKPGDLVVHPGAGNRTGTLLNGLLHYLPELGGLPRAGIVHRLDKGTSGLMVVAKTEAARQSLIGQLKARSVHRQYVAVVEGNLISGKIINQPIARDRHNRLKMAVAGTGKPAVTRVEITEKFRSHTAIKALLETGRTHQIRVHLGYLGHPLVGDKTYGARSRAPAHASDAARTLLTRFGRPALHARALAFHDPLTQKPMSFQCPVAGDIAELLTVLRDAEGEAD